MKLRLLISAIVIFSSLVYTQNSCPNLPVINYGGKIYHTVQIGNQCWLKENLDIGTMILVNQEGGNNGNIEKYCYNNDTNNCNVYGGLYQWNEAMQYASTPGSKGICPAGWHIPTIEEFQSLANMVQNDGNALKAIGQGTGSGAGTNTSGFSALLSGYRGNDGQSYYIGSHSRFWGSIENATFGANIIHLYYNVGNIGFGDGYKEFGYSVRCINDINYTSVFEESNQNQIPEGYSISQNYPNPFNPNTVIKYSIPKFCHVTIKLFDLLGKEISLLIEEDKNPGNYEIYFNGNHLASGIYYYRISAGEFLQSKKMILLQ